MATKSREEIHKAILEKGYWVLEDPAIGESVDPLTRKPFDLENVEAMDLLVTALSRQEIRDAIEGLFDDPILGYYRAWGQRKQYQCVLNNLPGTSDTYILEIGLCSRNATVGVAEGSHLHQLNAVRAPNGMLGIKDSRFDELALSQVVTQLTNGGFVVVDGRTGWKVFKGKVISAGIMTKTELKHWWPMPLPKTKDIVQKIEDMEAIFGIFCTNFKWRDTEDN